MLTEFQLNKGFTFFNTYNSNGILFNTRELLLREDFIDRF